MSIINHMVGQLRIHCMALVPQAFQVLNAWVIPEKQGKALALHALKQNLRIGAQVDNDAEPF